MSWHNKVVWSEGLFLRPQHFQQQDRYIEHLVDGRYKRYMLREVTCLLVGFYSLLAIFGLAALAAGSPERWDAFLATQQNGLMVTVHAIALVYTSEVLGPVNAAYEGLVNAVPKIDLTDEYLKRAGAFARMRAAEAAFRLAEIWRMALKKTKTSSQ